MMSSSRHHLYRKNVWQNFLQDLMTNRKPVRQSFYKDRPKKYAHDYRSVFLRHHLVYRTIPKNKSPNFSPIILVIVYHGLPIPVFLTLWSPIRELSSHYEHVILPSWLIWIINPCYPKVKLWPATYHNSYS